MIDIVKNVLLVLSLSVAIAESSQACYAPDTQVEQKINALAGIGAQQGHKAALLKLLRQDEDTTQSLARHLLDNHLLVLKIKYGKELSKIPSKDVTIEAPDPSKLRKDKKHTVRLAIKKCDDNLETAKVIVQTMILYIKTFLRENFEKITQAEAEKDRFEFPQKQNNIIIHLSDDESQRLTMAIRQNTVNFYTRNTINTTDTTNTTEWLANTNAQIDRICLEFREEKGNKSSLTTIYPAIRDQP